MILLLSYNELELIKDIDTKVILVQHTLAERYLFHSENKKFFKGLNQREPDYLVCSSEKDKELFKKNLMTKNLQR